MLLIIVITKQYNKGISYLFVKLFCIISTVLFFGFIFFGCKTETKNFKKSSDQSEKKGLSDSLIVEQLINRSEILFKENKIKEPIDNFLQEALVMAEQYKLIYK